MKTTLCSTLTISTELAAQIAFAHQALAITTKLATQM